MRRLLALVVLGLALGAGARPRAPRRAAARRRSPTRPRSRRRSARSRGSRRSRSRSTRRSRSRRSRRRPTRSGATSPAGCATRFHAPQRQGDRLRRRAPRPRPLAARRVLASGWRTREVYVVLPPLRTVGRAPARRDRDPRLEPRLRRDRAPLRAREGRVRARGGGRPRTSGRRRAPRRSGRSARSSSRSASRRSTSWTRCPADAPGELSVGASARRAPRRTTRASCLRLRPPRRRTRRSRGSARRDAPAREVEPLLAHERPPLDALGPRERAERRLHRAGGRGAGAEPLGRDDLDALRRRAPPWGAGAACVRSATCTKRDARPGGEDRRVEHDAPSAALARGPGRAPPADRRTAPPRRPRRRSPPRTARSRRSVRASIASTTWRRSLASSFSSRGLRRRRPPRRGSGPSPPRRRRRRAVERDADRDLAPLLDERARRRADHLERARRARAGRSPRRRGRSRGSRRTARPGATGRARAVSPPASTRRSGCVKTPGEGKRQATASAPNGRASAMRAAAPSAVEQRLQDDEPAASAAREHHARLVAERAARAEDRARDAGVRGARERRRRGARAGLGPDLRARARGAPPSGGSRPAAASARPRWSASRPAPDADLHERQELLLGGGAGLGHERRDVEGARPRTTSRPPSRAGAGAGMPCASTPRPSPSGAATT